MGRMSRNQDDGRAVIFAGAPRDAARAHPTAIATRSVSYPTASLAPSRPDSAAHRVLGLLGMLGAPATIIFTWSPPAKTDLTANLLMIAYLAGWACSIVGMRRLRATGSGTGARVLFAIQLLFLSLAACQQVQDQTSSRPLGDAFYFVSDMSWPFSHVFMLVIFAAVWRARVWTDWRRWVPLACGLALPLTFAAAALKVANPGIVFGLGTALSFGALGLAVLTSPTRAR